MPYSWREVVSVRDESNEERVEKVEEGYDGQ